MRRVQPISTRSLNTDAWYTNILKFRLIQGNEGFQRTWLQLGQNRKWLVGHCVKVTQMWTWAKYMGQPKKIYLEFSSRQEKKLKIKLSGKKLRRTTSNRQLFFCKIREEINYCVLKPWHCQNRTATQQTSTMHMLMPLQRTVNGWQHCSMLSVLLCTS